MKSQLLRGAHTGGFPHPRPPKHLDLPSLIHASPRQPHELAADRSFYCLAMEKLTRTWRGARDGGVLCVWQWFTPPHPTADLTLGFSLGRWRCEAPADGPASQAPRGLSASVCPHSTPG